jgi:glucose-1-phosphate thymidylyltransferase
VKALLLAAGYATRLYPLTRDRAKPLLDVGGRPILSHILDRVVELPGLSEVIVVANARFADSFRAWAAGAACPVPIRVLDDGSTSDADKLGATGDLAFALREAPLAGEDLLVVAGDNLLRFDLRPLHARFEARRRPTIVVRRVPRSGGPSPYNEVTLSPDGRVTGFREKPADPRTDLVAIALYFFPPEIEGFVRRYLAEGGNPDAPGHFIAWLVRQTDVHAVREDGEWWDIGGLDSLEAARARFG